MQWFHFAMAISPWYCFIFGWPLLKMYRIRKSWFAAENDISSAKINLQKSNVSRSRLTPRHNTFRYQIHYENHIKKMVTINNVNTRFVYLRQSYVASFDHFPSLVRLFPIQSNGVIFCNLKMDTLWSEQPRRQRMIMAIGKYAVWPFSLLIIICYCFAHVHCFFKKKTAN